MSGQFGAARCPQGDCALVLTFGLLVSELPLSLGRRREGFELRSSNGRPLAGSSRIVRSCFPLFRWRAAAHARSLVCASIHS